MSRKANKTKAVAAKEVVGAGFTPFSPNTYTDRFVSLSESARKEQNQIDSAFKASKQEALIKARALLIEAMGIEANVTPEIRENAHTGMTSVLAAINNTIGTLR